MLLVKHFTMEIFGSKILCCFILSLVVPHKQVISNANRKQEEFTVMPHNEDIQKYETFCME